MIHTLIPDGKTKSTQITLLMCQSMIEKWRERLNLLHWTIGLAKEEPEPHHAMEAVMTPTRQHLAIRINPKCWNYSVGEFEKLIIHEMLHPLFEPIQREYNQRMQDERDEMLLHRVPRPSTRHTEVLETTLDHIAKVIYNLKDHRPLW